MSLNLGVEYRHHRQVRYLTQGDIVEQPNGGGVELHVNDSDADLLMYRFGVTFTPF